MVSMLSFLGQPTLGQALDPIAFRLGPLSVYWYGIIIMTGAFLGQRLMTYLAKERGLPEDPLLDLFFYALIFGFLGARLYYVIFNWDFYSRHPQEILAIWHGGLAIYGGILAGALTVVYLARRYQLPLLPLLDSAAPGLMLAQAIGRWGNFMNQEAYGGVVTRASLEGLHLPGWLIDQMFIDGAYRQPTFLYESAWNFLGLLLILGLNRWWSGRRRGDLACLYLVWYGLGRFFIEGLRTDSLYAGSLRVSQVVSLVIVILGVVGLIHQHRNLPPVKQESNQ